MRIERCIEQEHKNQLTNSAKTAAAVGPCQQKFRPEMEDPYAENKFESRLGNQRSYGHQALVITGTEV